eukprot:7841765-Pyramimonas_sp.AAC.1
MNSEFVLGCFVVQSSTSVHRGQPTLLSCFLTRANVPPADELSTGWQSAHLVISAYPSSHAQRGSSSMRRASATTSVRTFMPCSFLRCQIELLVASHMNETTATSAGEPPSV